MFTNSISENESEFWKYNNQRRSFIFEFKKKKVRIKKCNKQKIHNITNTSCNIKRTEFVIKSKLI